MLIILISWGYIFLTSLNFGLLYKKITGIEKIENSIVHILGLFFYTITTSICAFFFRIHLEYYLSIFLINTLCFYYFNHLITNHLKDIKIIFSNFSTVHKLFFALLFFIVLAQSSTAPYLLDNESYYIQTIKWINEYGYVKGLANLHMFLAQNSGWHTLQAGFNFPFMANFFNDINGFLFICVGFLGFQTLSSKYNLSVFEQFNYGLILGFTLFFMQFINSPSPDLIGFLIAPYFLFQFIYLFKKITISEFTIILSLVLFLCFVKVTHVFIIIPVVILYIKHYSTIKSNNWIYFSLCSLTLCLFIFKNIVTSGYPLFPLTIIDFFHLDWKLPKIILNHYKFGTYIPKLYDSEVLQMSFLKKFKLWINLPKLDGLFNKAYLLILIIYPLFILKRKRKFVYIIIYTLAILQFVLVWNISPQYRFFFVFIIVLSILVLDSIIKNQKLKTLLIYLSIILSAIPIFWSINLNRFTSNSFAMKLSAFHLKNLVIPEPNSKTITLYKKEKINDFEFYSPSEDVFFWSTGDGDLPCVNKLQLKYFLDYFHYYPTLRNQETLKDGFKSVKKVP